MSLDVHDVNGYVHVCTPDCTRASTRIDVLYSQRNSTSFYSSSPDTFWGKYEEIGAYNVHLNTFERLWAAWYAFMQNDVLATGIMSFLMHEIVYFGRSLPWIIIDRIPAFNKYKIQNVRRSAQSTNSEANVQIAKSPNRCRAVELRQARPSQSFHSGAPPDMVGLKMSPV